MVMLYDGCWHEVSAWRFRCIVFKSTYVVSDVGHRHESRMPALATGHYIFVRYARIFEFGFDDGVVGWVELESHNIADSGLDAVWRVYIAAFAHSDGVYSAARG